MSEWIFKDNKPQIAKAEFRRFLLSHNIAIRGHFESVMESDEGTAWRYPAYAAEICGKNKKTIKKIKLLATDRGNNKNDVERNYRNQLEEFRGMYCMCNTLGYGFVDWDSPSGKKGVGLEKDCDLALLKDGNVLYADVKDCSGEVMSQKELDVLVGNSPDDPVNKVVLKHNIPGVSRYKPKTDLSVWFSDKIKEARDKGADILVCHFPWRGMPDLTRDAIRNDYEDLLGSAVWWNKGYPILRSNITASLHAIVVVSILGCWIINVEPVQVY